MMTDTDATLNHPTEGEGLSIATSRVGCEHCFAAIYGQAEGSSTACPGCRSRVLALFAYRNRPRHSSKPATVDFSYVPEHQQAMHMRLENWGRSCNGGYSPASAPGFDSYRSPHHWASAYASTTRVPTDRSDSVIMQRAVYLLPAPHMKALQWFYVQRTSVMQGRRALACTAEALAKYVIDARQMLINRDV